MVMASGAAPAFAQDPAQPAPQLLSHLTWQTEDERLQRFTAIDTRDGVGVLLLTDQGVVVTAQLARAFDGQIASIEPRTIQYLRDPEGQPLDGPWRNAQGVAIGGDGRIFVAFEGYGRVWSYDAPDAPAIALPVHADFARLGVGVGLSGLAVSRSGVLYAIPQRPARMTNGTPSYHFWNGEWEGSFRLPSDGEFHPVGADIGPDDRLYVLERESGAGGYRNQVRRFVLQGSRIDAGTVVIRSVYGQFGDLSGLTVWQGSNGGLRLLMVSHVNGPAAGGEIVEFALPR